jgi:shikimate kinase
LILPADRNLALVGFMTAGKSLVGNELSRRTGMPLVDIDLLICEIERMSVQEIFKTRGEPYFRRIESQVLNQFCTGRGQVISCGGGTVLDPANLELLGNRCVTVWLRVSEAVILRRLEDPTSPQRPLLESLEPGIVVHKLLLQREPLYAQADIVVDTDGRTVQEVADTIVRELGIPTTGA